MSSEKNLKVVKRLSKEEADDIASIDLSDYLQRRHSSAFELYPGTEMNVYDYTAERQNMFATNIIESTAHLIKGCLGAGMLGVHEGFMNGGLWTSLGAAIVLGILVPYCMYMLINSAQIMYVRLRVPRLSYPDLAEVVIATGPLVFCRRYSKAARRFVELLIFIEYNGTCCIFEIMIAHTIKRIAEAVSPFASSSNMDIRIYITISAVPILLICMIRSLKYLAPFSLVADLFTAMCVIAALYSSVTVLKDIHEVPAWKSLQGFFRCCGVFMFSIEGIGVALPIENNMRRPKYFSVVLQIGMSVVASFVTLVGFFGYWAWGEDCKSPITVHMPLEIVPILMQFMLTAALAVTFAVHFWVTFHVIWHYISKKYKRSRGVWERVYRAGHVVLLSCLSIAFPNLNRWMSFLGNFLMGFVVFILPPIIEVMVLWKEHGNYFRLIVVKNVLVMVLGMVLCGGALYSYT